MYNPIHRGDVGGSSMTPEQIIRDKWAQGLSPREIAEITELPIRAVYEILRAIQRKILEE